MTLSDILAHLDLGESHVIFEHAWKVVLNGLLDRLLVGDALARLLRAPH